MPITPTYPGVYIEEVPSGVRTITGVPTAIAAFIGRAYRGPVDYPVRVQNWGDFERAFGGLRVGYPLGNAVYDFFRNGGGEALVVRMFVVAEPAPPPDDGDGDGGGEPEAVEIPIPAAITHGGVTLRAASPGSWGKALRMRVDHDNRPTDLPWMTTFDIAQADLFNLTLRDTVSGAEERYVNLTVKESPRRVDRVLSQQSMLMRTDPDVVLPTTVPAAHQPATANVWTDNTQSAGVPENTEVPDSENLGAFLGSDADQTGLYALDKADIFNILVIPPDVEGVDVDDTVYQNAPLYCVERRAMLIVDPPLNWTTVAAAEADMLGEAGAYGLSGTNARNAAIYFPRVRTTNPLLGVVETTPASGLIAGAYARTDAQRGVWKAPAGIDVALNGTQGLEIVLTDEQNGVLNPLGVNCLRSFPVIGRVIWGARTLRGANVLADEYKYVPVRRLALFIEESLYRGTQWVVFEPNDEPLWSQIRLNVGAFMHDLFRQGAFQGQTPREAYLVKCDKETTTQFDIDRGIVNIVVGFAPLKPAEFVIIRIQQLAGQQTTA
jgi:phage tail sheath protein FI